MNNWYEPYLCIYGKPFADVPSHIVEQTRERLAALQSAAPVASVVIIAYNEETRLQACLWSISQMRCRHPVEIIGVDNNSADRTADVFRHSGIPFYTEERQSCGYARQCGLDHAAGRYYIGIDADTLYPPDYFELMIDQLMRPGVVAVSARWSYFPDERHSRLGLMVYEACRDLFLWMQHFKRPELSVRGLVFAYDAHYGRREHYRVDIRRGEDGSMALALKKYGRIRFVGDRRARAVTGYGTLNEHSLLQSLWHRIRIQGRGLWRIFYRKDHYDDTPDNLIQQP